MSDNETYSWNVIFCGGSKDNYENNTIKKINWNCWILGYSSTETYESNSKIYYRQDYLCTPFGDKIHTIHDTNQTIKYACCCYEYDKTTKLDSSNINIGHPKTSCCNIKENKTYHQVSQEITNISDDDD